MATFVAGYNPTAVPILIDDLGHQLGGYEWGPVRAATDMVRSHVDAGRLILHPDLPKADDLAPEATDALERAEMLTGRAEDAEALTRDQLVRWAAGAGVIPSADEAPDTPTLVVMAAYSTAALADFAAEPEPPPAPAPAPAKRAGRASS